MPQRFAVLSHVFPPSWSGQAVVLSRLLENLEPSRYCLISCRDYTKTSNERFLERLPATYHHLPPEPALRRGYRFGLGRIRLRFNAALGIRVRALRVAKILRREGCRAVVSCSGDLYDLPSSWLASRLTEVPLVAYVFDDYANQWTEPTARSVAMRWEPRFLRGAVEVIVPNEFMANELARRHDVATTVIHNPAHASSLNAHENATWPSKGGQLQIVYTGAIYQANLDGLRTLVSALSLTDRLAGRLHLYTPQPAAQLEKQGLTGPVVFHPHLAPAAAAEAQRTADILFLPLTFSPPLRDVIATSAPGKLGDYLAAGRPLLAHAPADSYVAWYVREHHCGVVVDDDTPEMLVAAIRRIASDEQLRRQISDNARVQAKIDFDPSAARASFTSSLARVTGDAR